jgi:hypothetical protein
VNRKNATRQGPAFRALVRGLDETNGIVICMSTLIDANMNRIILDAIDHSLNQSK